MPLKISKIDVSKSAKSAKDDVLKQVKSIERQKMDAQRKRYKERLDVQNDGDSYFVVLFPSSLQKNAFLKKYGLYDLEEMGFVEGKKIDEVLASGKIEKKGPKKG